GHVRAALPHAPGELERGLLRVLRARRRGAVRGASVRAAERRDAAGAALAAGGEGDRDKRGGHGNCQRRSWPVHRLDLLSVYVGRSSNESVRLFAERERGLSSG